MKPTLRVVDRGRERSGIAVRDLYLVHGEVGQETLLHECGVSAGQAAKVAAWFRSAGVPVEEVVRPACVPAPEQAGVPP